MSLHLQTEKRQTNKLLQEHLIPDLAAIVEDYLFFALPCRAELLRKTSPLHYGLDHNYCYCGPMYFFVRCKDGFWHPVFDMYDYEEWVHNACRTEHHLAPLIR